MLIISNYESGDWTISYSNHHYQFHFQILHIFEYKADNSIVQQLGFINYITRDRVFICSESIVLRITKVYVN